jgi:hypothetical protein
MATQAAKSNSRQQPGRKELEVGDASEMGRDLMEYFREYARENPETTALWCLGIGFILGWKLKPW